MQVPSALLIPTTQILQLHQLKVRASNFDSMGRVLCWLGWSSRGSITSQWLDLFYFLANPFFGPLVLYSWEAPADRKDPGKLKLVKRPPSLAAPVHSAAVVPLWQKARGYQLDTRNIRFAMAPEVFTHSWLALCLWGLWQAAHCGRELLVSLGLSNNHMNNR